MSVVHSRLSKGAQTILHLIQDASGEGGIMRWQGLRLLGVESAGHKLHIPLDNDGNMIQQYTGLERWCQSLGRAFGFKKTEASLISLAYVARQIRHENHLLNNQTAETKQYDSENLERIRDTQWGFDTLSAAEQSAKDMFHLVACVLTTPDRRQGLSTEYLKKIEQASGLLAKANAAFYVETGVAALLWARNNAGTWAVEQMHSGGMKVNSACVDAITQEAVRAAELLAANAYGNNAGKVGPQMLENLMKPLSQQERARMISSDTYMHSRTLAALAAPSRAAILPSQAGALAPRKATALA